MKGEILKSFLTDEYDLDGWFYDVDMLSLAILDTFQNQYNIKGGICELGVYKGKSLTFFSHFIRDNEKLYGYDTFPEDYYECTQEALKKYGLEVDIELIKVDSCKLSTQEIRRTMNNKGVRILHIDAGHEYHEVLHSLLTFSPIVYDSGIIVMDDYQDLEFPGIEAAVLDFCEIDRPRRFIPFFSGRNKMFLCSRHLASRYQLAMLTDKNLKNSSRLTIVRDFKILKGFSKLPTKYDKLLQQINEFDLKNSDHFKNDINQLKEKAEKYAQDLYGGG